MLRPSLFTPIVQKAGVENSQLLVFDPRIFKAAAIDSTDYAFPAHIAELKTSLRIY
jgi:hypothetical protein